MGPERYTRTYSDFHNREQSGRNAGRTGTGATSPRQAGTGRPVDTGKVESRPGRSAGNREDGYETVYGSPFTRKSGGDQYPWRRGL